MKGMGGMPPTDGDDDYDDNMMMMMIMMMMMMMTRIQKYERNGRYAPHSSSPTYSDYPTQLHNV